VQSSEVSCAVELELEKPAALPVADRTQDFPLGVVEAVRHVGNAGGSPGIHHAEKIEIDLQLRVIGVLHVIVDEYIRNKSCSQAVFAVDREQFTNPSFHAQSTRKKQWRYGHIHVSDIETAAERAPNCGNIA
jgi:hypothetical protein